MKKRLSFTALLVVCAAVFIPVQSSAIEHQYLTKSFQFCSETEFKTKAKQSNIKNKKNSHSQKRMKPEKKGWLIFWLLILLSLAVFFAYLTGLAIAGGILLGEPIISVIFCLPCLALVFLCIKGISVYSRRLRELKEEAMKIENR
jgi:cobalamin synthase